MTQPIMIPERMPLTNELVALDQNRVAARRVERAAYSAYKAASRANDANLRNIVARNRYDEARREWQDARRIANSAEQRVIDQVLEFLRNN